MHKAQDPGSQERHHSRPYCPVHCCPVRMVSGSVADHLEREGYHSGKGQNLYCREVCAPGLPELRCAYPVVVVTRPDDTG